MKKTLLALTILACVAIYAATPSGVDIQRLMLTSYLKVEIASRVAAESTKMGEGADDAVKAELFRASGEYRDAELGAVRRDLSALLGDRAQKAFASFVDAFVKAEKEGSMPALVSLSKSAGLATLPESFAALRSAAMKTLMAEDISRAGKLLGGIQTWLRLRAKGDVPPLHAWLHRDEAPAAVAQGGESAVRPVEGVRDGGASPPKPKKKRNSLRDAEAGAGEFVEAQDDAASSLRSFGAMRKMRRDKAISDAEAGMAQVAAERKSADDEYNAKKAAEAQAEAVAMQAHAQRLAATEQEAVVQDQNSWRTRLKSVAATAVGAAGSAFLGNVGGRLGEAAAEAVFKDDRRSPR